MSYGSVKLDAKLSLLEADSDQAAKAYTNFKYPVTFEALQQYSGFMLYETTLPNTISEKGLLIANNVHDRALVYINRVSEENNMQQTINLKYAIKNYTNFFGSANLPINS